MFSALGEEHRGVPFASWGHKVELKAKGVNQRGQTDTPSVLIVYVRSSLHACLGFFRLSRP